MAHRRSSRSWRRWPKSSASEAGSVDFTVDFSGTGGGFKRFARRDGYLRCVAADQARGRCGLPGQNNINYYRFEIAYDGLSVVVNSDNDWVDCITVDQLKMMWSKDSTATKWSDINPSWPYDDIVDSVRPRDRLRNLRLLHTGDQRRGRSLPRGLQPEARMTMSWLKVSPARRAPLVSSGTATTSRTRNRLKLLAGR